VLACEFLKGWTQTHFVRRIIGHLAVSKTSISKSFRNRRTARRDRKLSLGPCCTLRPRHGKQKRTLFQRLDVVVHPTVQR